MTTRAHKVIQAAFATGQTTATYTEQIVNEDGGVVRQRVGLEYFSLAQTAMLSVGIPSGVAAGVDALHFQTAYDPTGTWYDLYAADGTLITVESVQDIKGSVQVVKADVCAGLFLRIVPVDSGDSATAPGAVTFELGAKA